MSANAPAVFCAPTAEPQRCGKGAEEVAEAATAVRRRGEHVTISVAAEVTRKRAQRGRKGRAPSMSGMNCCGIQPIPTTGTAAMRMLISNARRTWCGVVLFERRGAVAQHRTVSVLCVPRPPPPQSHKRW